MRKGDYVMFADRAWCVWLEHADGSLQIKCLNSQITGVDNMQVFAHELTKIPKEIADIMRGV